MSIAVTGGAGYIGSQMVRLLRARGLAVVIVDDFSNGHRDCIPPGVPLFEGDIADPRVARFFTDHQVDSVIHFAARALVAESVVNPRLYWRHNTAATAALLDSALDAGVQRLVFSSTCAIYGVPDEVPIAETQRAGPINPYGRSKWAIEEMLADYARAYDFRYVSLRYFNAAGAAHGLGERHLVESHLIPIVLQVALGQRREVMIHGTDYATPDGSCVRDYVHVSDLAEAHLLALDHLGRRGESGAFNLGTGLGRSVREVIEAARRISGREIRATEGPRRPGDPDALVADPRRARSVLGWTPVRSDLETILRDAWAFHLAQAG